jgi:hypothetical protein
MERRTFIAVCTVAPSVLSAAGDSDFNGRWDISVPGESRRRAWWLEIKGAGSGSITGSFIGAPGGGLNQITNAKVDNGELTWSFDSWRLGQGKDAPRRVGVYRARMAGDKLEGTLTVEGDKPVTWTAVRAPRFPTTDVSKAKPGKPIELFNGKDLSGWKPTRENAPMLWKVEDGIMKNQPGTTDIYTESKFWDFKLHSEYRLGQHSNSGIGLRGRYEIQLIDDYGRPPSKQGHGALYSRIEPAQNASKAPGEWQTSDITLVGNRLTVVLNGVTLIDNGEVEGLTAIAIDPDEGQPGPIVVQGDHGIVEFRKMTLTPLTSARGV